MASISGRFWSTSPGIVVATSTTRSTEGRRRNALLPPPNFLGRLGHREGKPRTAVGLLEQFVFEIDAFQSLGLKVQQIVVVAEKWQRPTAVAAVATTVAVNVRRGKANKGRSQEKRRFSGVGRLSRTPSGSNIRIIAGSTVDSASRAQQHAPRPGKQPQFGQRGKLRQAGREKSDRRGQGARSRRPVLLLAAVATSASLVDSVFLRSCR